MKFTPGIARPLYRQGIHPRLMLGPRDLPALRRATAHGLAARLMAALRDKVRPLAQSILTDDTWRTTLRENVFFWPKSVGAFAWALPDIALVGLIDGDPELIEAVCRVFRALPELFTEPRGGLVERNYYMPPLFIPFAYDLIAAHLTPGERRRYARWALEAHLRGAIRTRRDYYLKMPAHNMTLGGMELALVTLLAIVGDEGVPDLAREQTLLLRWLEATLHTAIGTDGYPEEDIGYGTVVVPMLAQVVEPLRRAGIFDVYAACPHYAQFGQAMLHFVQPWGEHLSNTGDHGDQLRDRQFILARQASETRDPALLWLIGQLTYSHGRTFLADPVPELDVEMQLRPGYNVPVSWLSLIALDDLAGPLAGGRTGGLAGRRPTITPTAYRDRGRGLVSFRSNWDADATFVTFDGSQRSPAAPGHAHDSCGHFSLSALGEHFAIDTGRYSVEQDQHNLLLIDGKSGRSTNGEWTADYHPGRLIDYQPHPFCDTAAVDSSHQHNCFWAWRWLGLVKGKHAPSYAWIVDDVNKANDWAEFWWTLNTSPENTITIPRSAANAGTHKRATANQRATIRGHRHGNHLDIHFALPAASSYSRPHTLELTQDVTTPSSTKYVGNAAKQAAQFAHPADMLHGPVFQRPRLIAKIAGFNGKVLALLIPRRKGERAARVPQLRTLDNSLAVQITFEKVEDTLIWAYDHKLLEAGEVKARGRWVMVRRARGGGLLMDYTLGEGTSLSVAGREIEQNGSEQQ